MAAADKADASAKDAPPPSATVVDVTIHPLVLLSATDHYHRVARGTRKRAVGVLLGSASRGRVDATNSFAVPFEEDSKDPAIFYLDHNYLENMLAMFRKVHAKERVVGFYSTGPQIRPNDLRIYELVRRAVPPGTITPPVFVIIDVRPGRESIPTTAYRVVEEVDSSAPTGGGGGGKKKSAGGGGGATATAEVRKSFAHVPSVIGAMEAEEVGVEHLLRDINDPTVSTVANLVKAKLSGLSTLTEKLVDMKDYLTLASKGKIKPNPEIVANMQAIVNLLPNLNVDELVRSMLVKNNDMHMVIYLSSLIRCVIALHDLVVNKIAYNDEVGDGLEKVKEKKAAIKGGGDAGEEKKEDDGDSKKAAAGGGDKTAESKKKSS
jgi:26S proteasome regulatory subunit N8